LSKRLSIVAVGGLRGRERVTQRVVPLCIEHDEQHSVWVKRLLDAGLQFCLHACCVSLQQVVLAYVKEIE
jgi:hypothetical protein